jgi:hypothetical protein
LKVAAIFPTMSRTSIAMGRSAQEIEARRIVLRQIAGIVGQIVDGVVVRGVVDGDGLVVDAEAAADMEAMVVAAVEGTEN